MAESAFPASQQNHLHPLRGFGDQVDHRIEAHVVGIDQRVVEDQRDRAAFLQQHVGKGEAGLSRLRASQYHKYFFTLVYDCQIDNSRVSFSEQGYGGIHMKLLACLVGSSVVLSANTYAAPAPPALKATIIGSDSCLVTGTVASDGHALLPAIAAIVLPVVIELAIDATRDELKKVRTTARSGDVDFYLYKTLAPQAPGPDPKPRGWNLRQASLVDQMPKCITILTGSMADQSNAAFKVDHVDTTVGIGANAEVLATRLKANGLDLEGRQLYSVVEIERIISDDGTAFKYAPRYVKVFRMLPGGGGARSQGLVVNLSIRGAGASPNGTVYSLAPIDLGAVSAGFELHADRDADKMRETGYLVMPGMSDQAYRAYARDVALEKFGRSYMPVNFRAELVQTQKPGQTAEFIASVLDKAKPKISEAAGAYIKDLDPFKSSQARYDAQIALATAKAELVEATTQAKKDLATIKIAKAQAALDELDR